MRGFVMSDEQVPNSGACVVVVVRAASRQSAGRWMDAKLTEVRERPEDALRWLEETLLRGLSGVGRTDGPEHVKRTGRQAGGGTLTKGS